MFFLIFKSAGVMVMSCFLIATSSLVSDTTIFPPQETLDNCTVYKQFDESTTSLYSYLWKKLKSE